MRVAGRAPLPARAGGSESGSLTLMLAVMFVALLAVAGIVIDGGAKLDDYGNATAAAQEAARAGAGMVNQARAYSAGSFAVDRSQAIAAAQNYLATTGYQGAVTAGPGNDIHVIVRVTSATRVLSIIGIDTMTSIGSATAVLVAGVRGPGQ